MGDERVIPPPPQVASDLHSIVSRIDELSLSQTEALFLLGLDQLGVQSYAAEWAGVTKSRGSQIAKKLQRLGIIEEVLPRSRSKRWTIPEGVIARVKQVCGAPSNTPQDFFARNIANPRTWSVHIPLYGLEDFHFIVPIVQGGDDVDWDLALNRYHWTSYQKVFPRSGVTVERTSANNLIVEVGKLIDVDPDRLAGTAWIVAHECLVWLAANHDVRFDYVAMHLSKKPSYIIRGAPGSDVVGEVRMRRDDGSKMSDGSDGAPELHYTKIDDILRWRNLPRTAENTDVKVDGLRSQVTAINERTDAHTDAISTLIRQQQEQSHAMEVQARTLCMMGRTLEVISSCLMSALLSSHNGGPDDDNVSGKRYPS